MNDVDFKKRNIKKLYYQLMDNELLTEEQEDKIIDEIKALSPDPKISDYIFWEGGLTIDEIIEKAFSYKPIILGDQSQKGRDD
ncbi:MAG TPA: hypothetical protein DD412_04395 [Holosporales bacterium]|nr:hypothetical protein [Holosporales bacterium]